MGKMSNRKPNGSRIEVVADPNANNEELHFQIEQMKPNSVLYLSCPDTNGGIALAEKIKAYEAKTKQKFQITVIDEEMLRVKRC